MSITINGQLLLAMLAEKLTAAGAQVIMANTDGLECIIRKENYSEIIKICEEWESLTNLTLEYEQYSKMFVRDVNNYTAVTTSGEFKQKGAFEVDKWINKDHSKRVVALAVQEYVASGTPVETTIRQHEVVEDFFVFVRCKKTSQLCFDDNGKDSPLQRINRLIISKSGVPMYKRFTDGRKIGVFVGNNLSDFNLITDDKLASVEIDYDYYIKEANKIIDSVEHFNNVF